MGVNSSAACRLFTCYRRSDRVLKRLGAQRAHESLRIQRNAHFIGVPRLWLLATSATGRGMPVRSYHLLFQVFCHSGGLPEWTRSRHVRNRGRSELILQPQNWCGEGDLFSGTALKIRKLYTPQRRKSSRSSRSTRPSHTPSHTLVFEANVKRTWPSAEKRNLAQRQHRAVIASNPLSANGNRTSQRPVQYGLRIPARLAETI